MQFYVVILKVHITFIYKCHLRLHKCIIEFIQFLYKDPRWKLMQYHDEVVKTYGDLHSSKQSSSETSTEAIAMLSFLCHVARTSCKNVEYKDLIPEV